MSGYAQSGAVKDGTGVRVSFNRVSIEIPKGWRYSSNPAARPGTDQLQLFSGERKRTVLVTLTKARDGISLSDAVRAGSLEMVRRGHLIPGFENCFVGGSGSGPDAWGRKGILALFKFYKNEKQDEKDVVMKIYNYGEELPSTKEVLFYTVFLVGGENPDYDTLLRSVRILP
jgi:hypothetical protein